MLNIVPKWMFYFELFEIITPQTLCKIQQSWIIGVMCLLSFDGVIEALKSPYYSLMLKHHHGFKGNQY